MGARFVEGVVALSCAWFVLAIALVVLFWLYKRIRRWFRKADERRWDDRVTLTGHIVEAFDARLKLALGRVTRAARRGKGRR